MTPAVEGVGASNTAAAGPPIPRWLPNAITLLRIALLGLFLVAMGSVRRTAMPPPGMRGLVALAALLAIGGSDVLDGYLARRFDLTSRLGVILDAAADKIAQLGITSYFVLFTPLIPLWFLLLILGRDLVIGAGTWWVRRVAPGMPLRHRAHGKAASTVMFGLFTWTLLGGAEAGRQLLLLGVAGLVVVSTVAYVAEGTLAWRERRTWDDQPRRPPKSSRSSGVS